MRENEQMKSISFALVLGLGLLMAAPRLLAHEITIKGTVAGIEAARIQVKTGEEGKGQQPTWFAIDAKTKVMRGKQVLSLSDAKIAVGEPVMLIVFHESNVPLKTLEIHLPARPSR
jgi:hypothetical protein